jgi:DnaJ-class molecular chaperone
MIEKFYKMLNLTSSATIEEVEQAYQTLKEKYKAERFLEGEAGNDAARRLTEIETAYNAIKNYNAQQINEEKSGTLFAEIETALKSGDVTTAQQKLDLFDERNAEWHYLQSVVFYKKNWINESKKQLEIAVDMAPNVQKYKDALTKMTETVNRANEQAKTNSSSYTQTTSSSDTSSDAMYGEEQQLGGGSCMEWCCQMLACNLLLNCCCNCG